MSSDEITWCPSAAFNAGLSTSSSAQFPSKKHAKSQRKLKEKSEAVHQLYELPFTPNSLNAMLSPTKPFVNSPSVFRILGDIYINEDALRSSLGCTAAPSENQESLTSELLQPNISLVNFYQSVEHVILSKNSLLCHVFFKAHSFVPQLDWRIVANRFDSYNNEGFKKIADLIRQIGESNEQQQHNESLSQKSSESFTDFFDAPIAGASSTMLPALKSRTSTQSSAVLPSKTQQSQSLKAIEAGILSSGKQTGSYSCTYKTGTMQLSSMQFSKGFLESAGWDIEKFATFCLFNGLPELLSSEEYYTTLLRNLTVIQAATTTQTVSQEFTQIVQHKVGKKYSAQTQLRVFTPIAGLTTHMHQVLSMNQETYTNSQSATSIPIQQKIRGRKHFSQSEQNTLEINLECPYNEMDRHAHRVCKFRILHNNHTLQTPVFQPTLNNNSSSALKF